MCDFETVSELTITARVARKAHRCYECGVTIKAGEGYMERRFIMDGWHTQRVCDLCEAALVLIDRDLTTYALSHTGPSWTRPDTCGPAFGELVEYIEDETMDREEIERIQEAAGEAWPRAIVQAFVDSHVGDLAPAKETN